MFLILALWQYTDINQIINIYSITFIYIPLLLSVFYISYTSKPQCVLTRRLGVKQKASILLCHLCLTSIYLSLIYLYEARLTSPLVSILLVIHSTNLLFHTLKIKYLWLMPVSIGYFAIATSKILLWDVSGFTVLQKLSHLYPNHFKMQDSVGIRNALGKALIEEHGYSLFKINNAA
ncbi:hypothetical protein [Pseudoalteromonas sp. NBT06-2]|uniref:hypothetical protein n=1 Tax=Pseudoalteromonas sp. NBT06-2 TaxID=2025950 RepID=UPI0014834924|nr:hypothetical protein [Pseudoalteromonas sp. NBT06-2]